MTEERPAGASADEPEDTNAEAQTTGAETEAPEQTPESPASEPDTETEPERDIVAEAATPSADPPASRRGRKVIAALFWLLASLTVLVGGVTLWAHQTLLTADGWGGIVEDVIAEEEVTDAISVVLVDRLSESLGVREVVADVIPGPDVLAGALTATVESRITDAVADFAQSDAFQAAFVNVNKAAHDAAMRVIRGGESEAVTSEEGVIAINIFPLVEGVLLSLQENGLIGESREIPDLTDYQASPQAISAIETLLGRDIPDDVGTIVLIDSENLDLIQTVIRWFDLITIVLLGLWVLFTALALWLSQRRVRMVLWLAGGAIAALLAARFLTRLLLEAITRRQPELEARVVVSAIVDAAVDSLMLFTFVLMVIAVIVAIAAVLWERRDELGRPSMETPPRTIGRWVREHMTAILAVGIGVIGLIALWSIGGAGIAMLTAAAILLLVIAVKVMSDQGDDDEPAGSTAASAG